MFDTIKSLTLVVNQERYILVLERRRGPTKSVLGFESCESCLRTLGTLYLHQVKQYLSVKKYKHS